MLKMLVIGLVALVLLPVGLVLVVLLPLLLIGGALRLLVALLILLVKPQSQISSWIRRCPVCDHRLLRGKYCSECGSRV